jgi:hypothetical protein
MGLKMYTFFERLFILYILIHICETTPIFPLMSKNYVFKIKIHNFFVISNGASCHGASCLWGELSWGELSMGRVVHGASCPWGELSLGRVVPGASCRGASFDVASCLWGELSRGEWSGNHQNEPENR